MSLDKISPDQPITEDHPRSPLIDLALHPSKTLQDAIDRQDTIKTLIQNGATLTLRDYCRLIPADYACVGCNPDIAATIVLATLKHIEEKNLDLTWRPALNRFFATIGSERERTDYQRNLLRNAQSIRAAITNAVESEDPHILSLMQTQEEADYWLSFKAPPIDKLPMPPTPLIQQFTKVHSIANSMVSMKDPPKLYDLKAWHGNELFKLRFLQWETARFIP